jgi:DNA-binding transcriptional MerR regulator
MSPEDYLIHELAERAGVSVRTIRYYINEGLLPPPDSKGRYATYTESYLHRLELIQRLKDAFLPLKEIRERVRGLTDPQVLDLLATLPAAGEPSAPPSASPPPAPAVSSALDYINRLREVQQTPYGSRPKESRPRPAPPSPSAPPPPLAKRSALPETEKSMTTIQTGPERWERIELADGIELHVRQPAARPLRSQIQRLIEFARSLFNPQEGNHD